MHAEEHLVMKEDGLVVRSKGGANHLKYLFRTFWRENCQPITMEFHDSFISTLHEPTGAVKAATTRTFTPKSQSWGPTSRDDPRLQRTSSNSLKQRQGARSAEPSFEETAWRQWSTTPTQTFESADRADERINKNAGGVLGDG